MSNRERSNTEYLLRRERESRPHIRAAIFDSGGVLSKDPFVHIRDDISNALSLPVDRVNQAWRSAYSLHEIGKIDESEFWQRFQLSVGQPLDLPEGESLLVRAHRATYEPFPEVRESVSQLKRQGIQVVLLSNSWPVLEEFEEEQGTFSEFDEKYFSHKIGFRKPDPRAFEAVVTDLRKKKIEPHETIFIDDKSRNVDVANELGINGIVFQREKFQDDLQRIGIDIASPVRE